jgi:catechol 2,3-dioxygenase-like lactoylglutathione lyase family enzyme
LAILALDHVQLAMPRGGEERARRFYCGLLGMEELPKPAALQASGGVWFRSGSVELHLGVEAEFQPARKAHPGLRVDGIDSLAARLDAAGCDVVWDDRHPGVRRFYAQDPFGNRVEFLQPVG